MTVLQGQEDSAVGSLALDFVKLPSLPGVVSRRRWSHFAKTRDIATLTNHALLGLHRLDGGATKNAFLSSPLKSSTASSQRLTELVTRQARLFYNEGRRESGLSALAYGRLLASMRAAVSDPDRLTANPASSSSSESHLPACRADPIAALYGDKTQAIPVVASKVSLPSPESFNPRPLLHLLPPDAAELYSSPDRLLRAAPELLPQAGRAGSFFGDRKEYVALLQRMYPLHMLGWTTQPKAVNGVFAVPKGDKQRLIINATPGNARIVDCPDVCLPTPDMVTSLRVPARGSLHVAKVDLSNFYHQLLLPEWMCPYYALPHITADEYFAVTGQLCPSPDGIYPMCLTLPMGASHAVFLAQCANESVLYRSGALSKTDNIINRVGTLVRDPIHGIYIDDVFIFGLTKESVDAQFKLVLDAYAQAGLVVNGDKVVRVSDGAVDVVGLRMRGVECCVSPSPSKLWSVIADTIALLSARRVSGRQLSAVVGSWTWFALLRRPVLSVFCNVYGFSERCERRLVPLWASVRRELVLMLSLAPLLRCELDVDFAPVAVCTDASSLGGSVVQRPMSASLLPMLCSPPVESCAGEPLAVQPSLLPDDEIADFCPDGWRRVCSFAWSEQEHINVLEMRAILTATKWLVSRPSCCSKRVVLFTDSAVCYFSLSKGRSSSYCLLRVLRRVSARLLGYGVSLMVGWVSTLVNPADFASRHGF